MFGPTKLPLQFLLPESFFFSCLRGIMVVLFLFFFSKTRSQIGSWFFFLLYTEK
ncbi:hypothetical protein AOQ84DRAFT_209428 [Glonium stellatum]|uniref:Uncharacterized protein n=1 Tax=Glonium stellatum TaxID=574774 RepID=A0A8E2F5D9_9PEZI|nr:hypothetical protein AOQ84DRAFT_209428 [Glonium stellatum]